MSKESKEFHFDLKTLLTSIDHQLILIGFLFVVYLFKTSFQKDFCILQATFIKFVPPYLLDLVKSVDLRIAIIDFLAFLILIGWIPRIIYLVVGFINSKSIEQILEIFKMLYASLDIYVRIPSMLIIIFEILYVIFNDQNIFFLPYPLVTRLLLIPFSLTISLSFLSYIEQLIRLLKAQKLSDAKFAERVTHSRFDTK